MTFFPFYGVFAALPVLADGANAAQLKQQALHASAQAKEQIEIHKARAQYRHACKGCGAPHEAGEKNCSYCGLMQ